MAPPFNRDGLIHQRKVARALIECKKDWNPEKVLHSGCAFANDIDNWGRYIDNWGRYWEVIGQA